jgi:hypothetical protein
MDGERSDGGGEALRCAVDREDLRELGKQELMGEI